MKWLLLILALLIGLLSGCVSQQASSSGSSPPSDDTTPTETQIIDGRISDINLPSPVEGVESFTISVEIQNTGNVGANFEVRGSSAWLLMDSNRQQKDITPGQAEVFDFNAWAPYYTGQPEVSTSLNFELYASEKLVHSREKTLTVLMPQLKFTSYKVETSGLWETITYGDVVVYLTLEIKNEGRASAKRIMGSSYLLKEDGTVRHSASELFDYLAPGATHQVTLTLDGDWLEKYRIEIEVQDPLGSYDGGLSKEFTLDIDFPWQEIFAFLLPLLF